MRRRLAATERRERIIKACLAEARRIGSFSGISARAVARRAGCTHPILYRHFKNRNDLIREAARHLQDRTIKAMSVWAGNEEQTVVERIRGLMDLYLNKRSNREIMLAFSIILGSKGRRDSRIRAALVEASERYAAIIEGLIRKGMQRGELREDINPLYVAWRIIEMGMFIDYIRLFSAPDTNLRSYIRMATRSLLREITPPDEERRSEKATIPAARQTES